jgi:hypothetical protein
VIIQCQDNPRVVVMFTERYFPDEDRVGFCVDAQADGLKAHVHGVELGVWDPEHLPVFLDRLAADFRGWDRERVWTSNHIKLRASFHSRGHVSLTWTLRPQLFDSWEASITTSQEAGEQMKTLAADVRYFLNHKADA